jgi:hypothetical protein
MLIIRNFDFLSTEANLTFNQKGEYRYKTFFGGLMSLASVLISIIFTILHVKEFLSNEKVNIIVSSHNSYDESSNGDDVEEVNAASYD